MKGKAYVPDGMWRPSGVYIGNQYGTMECVEHVDRPSIADMKDGVSASGLLCWPTEYEGQLTNPMSLHAFPFDFDEVQLYVHQAEDSSADEYVFRAYEADNDEAASVRFFFGVNEALAEWEVRGHSKLCCRPTRSATSRTP